MSFYISRNNPLETPPSRAKEKLAKSNHVRLLGIGGAITGCNKLSRIHIDHLSCDTSAMTWQMCQVAATSDRQEVGDSHWSDHQKWSCMCARCEKWKSTPNIISAVHASFFKGAGWRRKCRIIIKCCCLLTWSWAAQNLHSFLSREDSLCWCRIIAVWSDAQVQQSIKKICWVVEENWNGGKWEPFLTWLQGIDAWRCTRWG